MNDDNDDDGDDNDDDNEPVTKSVSDADTLSYSCVNLKFIKL